MKRIWFFFFLILASFAIGATSTIVTEPLTKVFDYFQLSHDGTENSLALLAKEHWSRKDKERLQLPPIFVQDVQELICLFEQIGLKQAVYPKERHYDYVLILGAKQISIQNRLNFLLELEKLGVTYDKVFLLGSSRILDKQTETINAKNEAELLEKMYSKKKPYIVICAGQRPDGSRANTADTVRLFLKKEVKPKAKILVISSQPYILYQNRVIQHFLKDFIAETVGPKTETKNIEIYLEAISSYLNPVLD